MRLGIQFTRSGMARYVSHLDMQRMFSRAVRRTNIPVAYSNGFNPHMLMSFASALSVGMETEGDYLELRLKEDYAPNLALEEINKCLPSEVQVVFAGKIEQETKKLMALVDAAAYRLTPGKDAGQFLDMLREIKERDVFLAQKQKKKETIEIDIRPMILDMEILETQANVLLSLNEGASLNPSVLLEAIDPKGEHFFTSVTRMDLFTKTETGRKPLRAFLL